MISQVHSSGRCMVLAVTGGGTAAIGRLLGVPGGSASLLEAVVPYSTPSLCDWLGHAPDQNCSRTTALAMAAASFQRAIELRGETPIDRLVGVGCTAALVSSRPKQGDHRCHIATHTLAETRCDSLTLTKDARSRSEEEAVVAELLLTAIARACDVPVPALATHNEAERVQQLSSDASVALQELITGARRLVWWSGPSPEFADTPQQSPVGLLSGSFHPLHDGHRRLAQAARDIVGGEIAFEMPLRNADKPPLDWITVDERLSQFDSADVALTTAGTFVEKAEVLPGTVFVVGIDTALRVIDPQFYGGSTTAMHAALAQIDDAGCRFLVAARMCNDRLFTLGDIELPAGFSDLFTSIPESEFREDVSSTELRNRY